MHRIPDVEGPGRTPNLGRGLYHLRLCKWLFSSAFMSNGSRRGTYEAHVDDHWRG